MDYANEFVSQFCTQLALNEHRLHQMSAFYIFEDKRPGLMLDRFHADAEKFWAVHSVLYPPKTRQ